MDAREQKGIIIAAMCRIERQGKTWLVPSQSLAEKRYEVNLEGQGACTCPDHQEAGFVCKHIRAVKLVVRRETNVDGSITETKTVTFEERKTYRQDWPKYNLAQSQEKERFQVLLHDLCGRLPDFVREKAGRKPHSVRDSVFSMAYKVYSTFSARRFATDLRDAHERGFLSKPIPGMKVLAFLENPEFTPILFDLIERSAMPLKAVESNFAVDSTGFSSCRFETWYDHKYGVNRRKAMWVKLHAAVGVKTNIVTSVRILDKDSADCPQFAPLAKSTAKNFTINEVSGDKAYLSAENVELVAQMGGEAFIFPKTNTTGGKGGLFEKMFHYFQFRQEEFLAHYHKRSNIESTFSAIKRKFGDSVRSKTDVAMANEALCKVLCHNICCVIMEQCVLGIEPVFWQEDASQALRIADKT
jgi:transposase